MGKSNIFEFHHLRNLLSPSLFSEFSLTEGFSDKKALYVIETCKKFTGEKQWWNDEIQLIIRNKLIEAVARNVGSGENYGFGFPNDLLDMINNRLEFEVNEPLISDIFRWGCGMSGFKMVAISNGKEDEFFFQREERPRELISYSTMAELAYNCLKQELYAEYERLKNFILIKIPQEAWIDILDSGENIEKYL